MVKVKRLGYVNLCSEELGSFDGEGPPLHAETTHQYKGKTGEPPRHTKTMLRAPTPRGTVSPVFVCSGKAMQRGVLQTVL